MAGVPSPAVLSLTARLNNVGFSDIVKIRNRIMKLMQAGSEVYQFEGGEPFNDTPDYIKEAAARALSDNRTRYAPSSGIPELRTAIAEKVRLRNGIPASENHVMVVNGGMHGLFAAFQSVVNPGDEVLVFSPYWTPIKDLISHCEGTTVLVPTCEARRDGFRETLGRYVSRRTRAIYYNTPQNPTGIVFNQEEASAVAKVCRERDLVVIADEAYEDIIYDEQHVSIASLEDMLDRTITCFTLSKSYAMTGWRLGYAIASEPWMMGLQKGILYSTNGVSTPTQWAALAALTTPSGFIASSLAEYRERRDLLVTGLNGIGFPCSNPSGAFYAFPDVSRVNKDSRQAAEILLDRAHVATVPGIVFGKHGEAHLRFSFSTSLETINSGLKSLRDNFN